MNDKNSNQDEVINYLKRRKLEEYRLKAEEWEDPEIRMKNWVESFKENNFTYAKDFIEQDIFKHKELALPLLIKASESENGNVRYWSIYYLRKLSDPRAKQAFKVCLDRLGNEWGATILDAAEGLYKIGEKEFAIKYLVNLILDKDAHRDTRIRSAERLVKLGLKKVISSDENLDLVNIPPYLHGKFKRLFQKLS